MQEPKAQPRRETRSLGEPEARRAGGFGRPLALAVMVGLACLLDMAPTARADEYLPLVMGFQRQYQAIHGNAETQTVTGTRNLFGTDTYVITFHPSSLNDGLEKYYTTDDEGDVEAWGYYRTDEGFGMAYYPPVKALDAPLYLGKTWESTYDIYWLPDFQWFSQQTSYVAVLAESTIVVPAGTFHAFEIGAYGSSPMPGYTLTGEVAAETPEPHGWWYSEHVWLVQYETDDAYQLVSYDTPTPVQSTTWGRVKALYRAR
jgi:hypothetical protein